MYTRERIEEVLKHVFKYYSLKDGYTKDDFIDSVMMEMDNNFPIDEEKQNEK